MDICSRYVVDKLPKQLLSCLHQRQPKNHNDYKHLLKTCFTKVDEQFLSEHKHIVKTSPAGSCGVSVLLRDDTLYVCNVSDSRVLLGSYDNHKWSHELLTNDHNTKNENERALVRSRSSKPLPLRTAVTSDEEGDRIGGILMVTRSFGDGIFKKREMSMYPLIPHLPYITSEPEITIHKLMPTDRYAIISSDGLYEVLTPAMVSAFIEKQLDTTNDPTSIACGLLELQFQEIGRILGKTPEQVKQLPNRKTFMDDTSIIILVFQHLPPPSLVAALPPLSPTAASTPIAIPSRAGGGGAIAIPPRSGPGSISASPICTCETYTEMISSDGIRSLSRTPTNCLSLSSSLTPPISKSIPKIQI
eukprot:Phypoly_transcript_06965.p1 GENE.Phypoly_transcript_06965~~Phypoly_transcript_06965.p1  ORF type:complete len:360 (+),score=53.60 Phypoly_transcript_06965:321-1400(+)